MPQQCRLGVKRLEEPGSAAAQFVLGQARAQRLGEVAPERIQPVIGHFEDPADVGRLAAVEEEGGFGGVAITVPFAKEKTECHQRVEEVARRAAVQPEAAVQGGKGFRAMGEFGEHAQFNGAKQRLGRPEGEAGLEDLFGSDGGAHGSAA